MIGTALVAATIGVQLEARLAHAAGRAHGAAAGPRAVRAAARGRPAVPRQRRRPGRRRAHLRRRSTSRRPLAAPAPAAARARSGARAAPCFERSASPTPSARAPCCDDFDLELAPGAIDRADRSQRRRQEHHRRAALRLADPAAGAVSCGGVDLRDVDLDAWRRADRVGAAAHRSCSPARSPRTSRLAEPGADARARARGGRRGGLRPSSSPSCPTVSTRCVGEGARRPLRRAAPADRPGPGVPVATPRCSCSTSPPPTSTRRAPPRSATTIERLAARAHDAADRPSRVAGRAAPTRFSRSSGGRVAAGRRAGGAGRMSGADPALLRPRPASARRLALSVLLAGGRHRRTVALMATSGYLISRAAQRPLMISPDGRDHRRPRVRDLARGAALRRAARVARRSRCACWPTCACTSTSGSRRSSPDRSAAAPRRSAVPLRRRRRHAPGPLPAALIIRRPGRRRRRPRRQHRRVADAPGRRRRRGLRARAGRDPVAGAQRSRRRLGRPAPGAGESPPHRRARRGDRRRSRARGGRTRARARAAAHRHRRAPGHARPRGCPRRRAGHRV